MKILITGFAPFGGEDINPAYEAVRRLDDKITGADLIKKEIPTVFDRSIELLDQLLEEERPDITICVGQAGGRFELSVERVAINIDDARISDNEDDQPIDKPIFADGENAYFANLPIKAMVKEIIDKKNKPSMSLDDIKKGLSYAVKAAVENKEDIKAIGGKIC